MGYLVLSAIDGLRSAAARTQVSRCVRTHVGRRLGGALLGAALFGVGLALYSRYKRAQRRRRWRQLGVNVVVLHQFKRGASMPNLSTSALELETFLRMAGIEYVVDVEEPRNSLTRLSPWITINGEEMSDSELIIEHLELLFGERLDRRLSPYEHAIGRAVQIMLYKHTFTTVSYKRLYLVPMCHVPTCFPNKFRILLVVFWPLVLPCLRKFFYANEIGWLTERQVVDFLRRELRMLDDLVGNKSFLLGSAPCSYDAAVFAQLSQIINGCMPDVEQHVRDNHARLVQYHERMKARYWPDWEQCQAE